MRREGAPFPMAGKAIGKMVKWELIDYLKQYDKDPPSAWTVLELRSKAQEVKQKLTTGPDTSDPLKHMASWNKATLAKFMAENGIPVIGKDTKGAMMRRTREFIDSRSKDVPMPQRSPRTTRKTPPGNRQERSSSLDQKEAIRNLMDRIKELEQEKKQKSSTASSSETPEPMEPALENPQSMEPAPEGP